MTVDLGVLVAIIAGIVIPCLAGVWVAYAQLNARISKLRDDTARLYLSRELFDAHWRSLEEVVKDIKHDVKQLLAHSGRHTGGV